MNQVIREITVPRSQSLTIQIPQHFVDHKIEVIIFALEKSADEEVKAMAEHSAALIDEWQEPGEDLIWT